jgi:collagenase-like PrtC family protease
MAARPAKPEVLAPAGSMASLRAALQHGADAVYFGLQDGFNARARAANFALADLPEIVGRIHRAGARAYVTLNTLVFEPELPALEHVLRGIASSGVDALIVQDPAVCLLARAVCPQLELHASTQMTIAEPAAAPFATGLGCTRIVVPRELSVAEIERFAAGTDAELEVFVHGALCVSWSGQCLTSEAWGGRSANRGQCAQSCRMPYELVVDGAVKPLGDVEYLLSPKDLAGARAVPELLRVGVHTLKIEGRQKGPHYVATATGGYRRWVDALATGGDPKQAERQLAGDLLAMSLSYTRGFSDGFFGGSDHQTLVEGRFPKHRGVFVGTVTRKVAGGVAVRDLGNGRPWTGGLALRDRPDGPEGERAVALPQAGDAAPLQLRPGMGIVFDQGGPLFAVERQGDEWVLAFGQPGPDLSRVRIGDRVFATSDPAVASAVQREVRDDAPEPEGRIALDLAVRGAIGEPLAVVATVRGFVAQAASASLLQPARGAGLDDAILRDKLAAFGGTPFRLGALDASGLQPGLHVPASELKDLRRQLLAELLPQVERGPVRAVEPSPALPRVRAALPALPPAAHRRAARCGDRARLRRGRARLDGVRRAGQGVRARAQGRAARHRRDDAHRQAGRGGAGRAAAQAAARRHPRAALRRADALPGVARRRRPLRAARRLLAQRHQLADRAASARPRARHGDGVVRPRRDAAVRAAGARAGRADRRRRAPSHPDVPHRALRLQPPAQQRPRLPLVWAAVRAPSGGAQGPPGPRASGDRRRRLPQHRVPPRAAAERAVDGALAAGRRAALPRRVRARVGEGGRARAGGVARTARRHDRRGRVDGAHRRRRPDGRRPGRHEAVDGVSR